MSQYTYVLVKEDHQSLMDAYSEYTEAISSLKYPLEEDEVRSIRSDFPDSARLKLSIAPPGSLAPESPFSNMVDIRLTRVRLFLPSVTTKNGKLHAALTHLGRETLADAKNAQITFSHRHILYNIATSKPIMYGIIGDLNDPNLYALPGPFATWEINIPNNYNPGLVLTGVEKPYLEFEEFYRPMRITE
ncbi:hypothetical protein EAE96_010692 [Botrytis aclada]|nr:hypothetical protein EAE96_010692 [Botrytis aclada]